MREQPRGADERVARERELDGRREDLQRAGRGVVDDDGLGEPQVGGDGLAGGGRDGGAVEQDAERVAPGPVGAEEDAEGVERVTARSADPRLPRHADSRPRDLKAYDIRGLYGEQIDGDVAERIGRAFARVLGGPARQAGRASCGSGSGATCA